MITNATNEILKITLTFITLTGKTKRLNRCQPIALKKLNPFAATKSYVHLFKTLPKCLLLILNARISFPILGDLREVRSKWMLSNLSKDMHVERWNIYTSSH